MTLQFWGPVTILKKTPAQVLSCEICKLFKSNYFEEICERLLLNFFKRRLQHRCFPVDFMNYSGTLILLQRIYERLVLKHTFGGLLLIKALWILWKFLERFFAELPLATTSYVILLLLVFFLFADQWGLQPKINFVKEW